ncbi:hypothetical protein SMI01S_15980 [Sphingobacterium mizutaii NBRC 14946 = DSM 11724]|nr:hypothetical protein SMI01S_15980 [Sphingobacterium mizutaii NBRC 14946 = DSM 11724]
MLNGVTGNFCLDVSEEEGSMDSYFSESWSSNTKNYLYIKDETANLYNWSNPNRVEEIPLKAIGNNLEKFYEYLVSKSHKSDKDIVPKIIDIFKQFRTLTSEYQNPTQALDLLFILLASLEDDLSELDKNKWNISDITIPNNFDAFVERFKTNAGHLKPNLGLILRHSSGAIFQEAQKEVMFFDSQMDLFGTYSSSVKTKNLAYSSIHYTPSYLARSIVENVLKNIDSTKTDLIKILDPACGSGEFLIEVLKQLAEVRYHGNITIHGFDSSQTAINTTRFLLSYEKRSIWKERLSFEVNIVDDSLLERWDNDYSIIVMNPPFASWEHLGTKKSREAVRMILNSNFTGRPNQASAFFYKAVLHLAEGGCVGSVIPSSILTYSAYDRLRKEVFETINIDLLAKLGNFVFEDALTDVSMFVGHKPKTQDTIPTLLWTRNEKGIVHNALRELRKIQYSTGGSKDQVDFSIFKPDTFPVIEDSWKAVSFKEHSLIKSLKLYVINGKLVKLGDLFDVQQGIRTGNNNIFKISGNDYQNLPDNEKIYFRPVTDNESISNGYLKKSFYTWYPYDINGLTINTELDFLEKAPNYYAKVIGFKEILSNRARKDETNWWQLSEHRAWQRNKATKLISTEFGNSSSFAIDKSGDFVVERGYAWQSKYKFDSEDLYFYLSLFSSNFFDKLLSIYSRQLAGGRWYDLGKKHTKQIPIPNVRDHLVKESPMYSKMVEIGRLLSDGDTYVKSILDDIVINYYPNDL